MKKSMSIVALISVGVILLSAVFLVRHRIHQINGLYDTSVIEEIYGVTM